MNSDQQTRIAAAVNEEMTIDHLGGSTYEVKGKYEVDTENKTCDCPDHQYRNYVCKHILRTTLEITWGNVPAPESEETTTRPNPLVPMYENVPQYLVDRDHWVCWVNQRDSDPDHAKDWTKVPLDVNTGGFGSSTNPETWTDFESAVEYDSTTRERTSGIGFVVSESDDIIGIDIDDCRDPDSGEVLDEVADIFEHVGSYAEVSPSGTGLRIFVRGKWPEGIGNQTDLIAGDGVTLEVYEWGRYLTVTGYHLDGTPTDVVPDTHTIEFFAGIVDPTYEVDDA